MIKFRNSGTNLQTQLGIIRVLAAEFDGMTFDLEDFASAVANSDLMTAYGFTGNTALARGNANEQSRNSPLMNAKMYAEILRQLGWVSSYSDDAAYPIIVTELGKYVAESMSPIGLLEQSLLGICNPQEAIDNIRYDEKVRFFSCALKTLSGLSGVMYKHELCMGPMSIDDVDVSQFSAMLNHLKNTRKSYSAYEVEWKAFCKRLGMKPSSVDNMTRFPCAAMESCGWIEKVRKSDVYPPKSLQCFQITDRGRKMLDDINKCYDLRLDEFNTYPDNIQKALIRLGFYEFLERAGYDLEPIFTTITSDRKVTSFITGGRSLLFSPFQVLKSTVVNEALGLATTYSTTSTRSAVSASTNFSGNTAVRLCSNQQLASQVSYDQTESIVVAKIKSLHLQGLTKAEIIAVLFNQEKHSNQDTFYPLVAALFRILGFDCHDSRQGDNGSRMDALIKGPGPAIPIEIKSPGEEEYISVKAVRQAIENKVILLSRKAHPTDNQTASLVVGYNAPNERADVADLILAAKAYFGINVGVIPLDVLFNLVVDSVLDNKTVSPQELGELNGIATC